MGLSPKRLTGTPIGGGEGAEVRVAGRVLAKAGLGVTYGLAGRWGLDARADYLPRASRATLGLRYRL